MLNAFLEHFQRRFVIIFVHVVLQKDEHLCLVRLLIHGQEVVTNVGRVDLQLFAAVRVVVRLVVELHGEATLHDEAGYRNVVGDPAQPVEHLLYILRLLVFKNAFHH